MEYDDLAPDSEEEFEEKQQELLADARESKQELEAKQNEALEAIAEGEDFEEYEVVSLGGLELEVKAWMPGDTTDTVQHAMELAESEDIQNIKRSMSSLLEALDDMTVSEDYNMTFWREYYKQYGPTGMITAAETILKPAIDSMEDKQDGVDGFRANVERSGARLSDGNNRPDAE